MRAHAHIAVFWQVRDGYSQCGRREDGHCEPKDEARPNLPPVAGRHLLGNAGELLFGLIAIGVDLRLKPNFDIGLKLCVLHQVFQNAHVYLQIFRAFRVQ